MPANQLARSECKVELLSTNNNSEVLDLTVHPFTATIMVLLTN